MKYQSRWYVSEIKAHSRFMAKPMRSSAKPGAEADSKAIDYALWLLKRDGLDIDAMAEAVRAEHNAKYPPSQHRRGKYAWQESHPNAIHQEMAWRAVVEWNSCQYGLRPRFVHFEFSEPPRYVRNRQQGGRQYAVIHRVELPNWAAEIGEVEEIAA